MAANHTETYVFNIHIQQMYSIVRDARFVNGLHLSYRSETALQNGMSLRYTNDMSMSSWGEDIDIILIYVNDSTTQVTIKSECSLPTQVIDWGKNKKNVQQVYQYLASFMAYNHPAPPVQPQPTPPVQPQPAVSGRFCTRCGAQLNASDKFCTRCGTPIG